MVIIFKELERFYGLHYPIGLVFKCSRMLRTILFISQFSVIFRYTID